MTAAKLLKIKHLSTTGQILRTVDCPAGQVSVFRSVSPSELKPFQRAFAGLPGPERISITIDDDPFFGFEHNLVGFGEQFDPQSPTVREYLVQHGVPEDAASSIATSFGVDEVLALNCDKLNSSQARMVRILAAAHDEKHVLVLNDPFETIPGQWRERYAELLCQFAKNSAAIVVVSALSTRPECWIDNERVVRIQVGEMRQRTIGVSSAPGEIRDMLAQLRKEAQAQPTESSHSSSAPSASQTQLSHTQEINSATLAAAAVPHVSKMASATDTVSFKPRKNRDTPSSHFTIRRSYAIATGTVTVLLLAFAMYHSYDSESSTVDIASSNGVEAADTPNGEESKLLPTETESPASASQPDEGPNANVALVASSPQPEDTAVTAQHESPHVADLVLDLYPDAVKHSVLASFAGENGAVQPALLSGDTAEPPALVRRPGRDSDLLKLLEGASEQNNPAAGGGPTSSQDIVPAPPPMAASESNDPNLSDEQNWERRREIMRQRFLESIQAASASE